MANPTFSNKSFNNLEYTSDHEVMTVQGTLNKAMLLVAITLISAGLTWTAISNGSAIGVYAIPGGAILGLIIAIILVFKKDLAPTLAPLYAIFEGAFVGGISLMLAQFAPIAIMLTFGVAAIMLGIYRSGFIPVTDKLRFGIVAATGAVFVFYLITMILRMTGLADMPYLHDGSWLSIGISLLVIGIAAFNLLLDFDLIERGAEAQAPKYMEWYAAFGLLVTLIWLYLEILKLLAKLSRR
jgi:uncharacterized YccA/Bax inhibitor family protein